MRCRVCRSKPADPETGVCRWQFCELTRDLEIALKAGAYDEAREYQMMLEDLGEPNCPDLEDEINGIFEGES